MAHMFAWLGVSPLEIDTDHIEAKLIPESDSHYRMKYLHTQHTSIKPPKRHDISPRIQAQIETACSWYYQLYYPDKR
jgi:sulfotransferase